MTLLQPLSTVVLTCDRTVGEVFRGIAPDETHPWKLRVAETPEDVRAQVAFVHGSVADLHATVRALAESGAAVVMLLNLGDVHSAVAGMQLGAVDCVEWTHAVMGDLPRRAWRAWSQHHRLMREHPAARELERRNRQLAELNAYAQELAAVPVSEDVFGPAVRKIKEITGAVGVAMSTYDPIARELVVRHVSLSEKDDSVLFRMLGRRMNGMRFELTPDSHDRIVREHVADLRSLSDASFGAIAQSLSTLVERAIGVTWFRAVGFHDDGRLLGTMVLAGGKNSARPSDDELLSYASVTTNALKRWFAEQGMAWAESRYRLVAENVDDVIWQSDVEVRFSYLSPSASRLLGYPLEWMLGKPVVELLTPSSAKVARTRLEGAIKRVLGGDVEAGEPFELEMVCADGSTVWMEVVATPTFGPRGDLRGFTGVSRNISDRKRTQEALQQSEELFRAFMDQSSEGFAIIDDRGCIREWNQRLEALSQVPRSDAIGALAADALVLNLSDEKREKSREWLEATLSDLLGGGQGVRSAPMECVFEHTDGTTRVVRCAAFPVAVRDLRCVGIVMHDTTAVRAAERERLEIEAALQEASKMEAMGRLAGGVAHDFNNLLTAMAANLELAIQQLREGGKLERELLDQALACTKTAGMVTRQLLAFSKRQVVESTAVEVDELIGGLESMLVRMVGEHVRFQTQLAAGRCRIMADPAQLEQIVVNLVLNAAEATRGGGEVSVSTRVLLATEGYRATGAHYSPRRSGVRAGRYVAIEVVDNGKGMSDDVKKHLFEPFFTTKRGGHGTGLGLAAMHGAVEQANGFVEVFSELGRGTRIRVCWPTVAEEQEPKVRKSGLQARLPFGDETIMFVEDEQAIRLVAHRVLKRTGYEVLLASSGEEAMEVGKAHKGAIDLLVTDVVMPGMNGRALAEHWERIHPESAVLLTSGHTEDTLVQQGLGAGEFAFLSKPYTVDVLAKRVRELLDARRMAKSE